MVTGRAGTAGTFLTGLLPRIKLFCKQKNIDILITGEENIEVLPPTKKPKLNGIVFRPDQKKALRAVRKYNTGRVVFPTGSGKTIIACGIIAMFDGYRVLFLCHTKDLIEQTLEQFKKYFANRDIFIIGAGYKTKWGTVKKSESPILLATIQSFSKLEPKDYTAFFDITIVDEVHHLSSRKSQYGKVMERNLSPRKYGLTATIPTKQKEILINEGFFGETIAELSIKKGVKKGIIAKPKINLIPVPPQASIIKISGGKYKNYYIYGIVKNKKRNMLICREVQRSLKRGETTLIIIDRTEHGFEIQSLLKQNKIHAPFVYGATDKVEREKAKNSLIKRKTKVVICSKVWKEGINIPSLNHIINAAGMKEEKGVLQTLGRGLRTTKNKKTVRLTDFLDCYKYLAEHTVQRMQVYVKQGWI